MAQPPDTILRASPEEAEAIRRAIRSARWVDTPYGAYRPARAADAEALHALLSDPRVSGPLYTIPKPVHADWIAQWIDAHAAEAARGEGLLMVARDRESALSGFVDLHVWPERASAEFGGGIRADLQSASLGSCGAAALFFWLFETIGIRLIAMTNALDNIRTSRLLAHLGFTRGADRICITAEGARRPSMYWELRRKDWRATFDHNPP
ncbi:GNAT family N-acetyltransferase [Amphiplicatus metriothermophilus]|uniref:Protein N-acetyltransferase, RimJ/RimL family n=1 Tax=Amphiplicatus metriothermophilus TaxID=1519374 RepID=A0A239PQH4_9PROT|nr:GNAT family N-acetyltransferase [Amphiplicatus metriothermophilus]MBB5518460.1 RimJ/RimL family protein N-acetyltransferase [Amphiplicatus metriothermophilus]SNT72378.1 Protein N-acetyltransferase, RimJ/RimL family [Amphiplicatus metriothermophilus]